MKKLLLGCAVSALATSAYAQSTGSIDFQDEIVVVGASLDKGVAGVVAPDTSKAKAVLTQDFIQHQAPGQTINDIINQLPGVSFQNNDPYGSAGGKLNIRGFDSTRISQTFDGVPLNDTGNYALYSNQQLDPELIEQVNVNLGTTDVDSPTAAASGSTVNYRTKKPDEDFGVMMIGSVGRFDYMRAFGKVETGNLTGSGTRAFFSASAASNDTIFGGYGKIDKTQYNGRIYQPIGDSGDFISVAGHYNQNRNNFFGSVPLRIDTAGGRVAGPDSTNRFPLTKDERFYKVARCLVAPPSPGVRTTANSCGSSFDYRVNPSNTGNIRGSSKFTLSDSLTLFIDPSYQYVKANGGGTAVGQEGLSTTTGFTGQTGYIGGAPVFGRDLNGDGDILDTVRVQAPSQTQTDRFGLITSLRYDFDDDHSVRIAYSLDYGKHRQTGEVGFLDDAGKETAFPVNSPLSDAAGNILQKRDRKSKAILNQIAGEYRGQFLDDALVLNLGVRAPFFKRKLDQLCFTSSASGFVDCFGTNTAAAAAYAVAFPTRSAPQKRTFKYDKPLPNLGLTYDVNRQASLFFSYSKGLQVPGTDNLYQSFFFPLGTPEASPTPETTDNFDFGVRYRSSKLQAQLSGWYTIFQNRLASAYDRDLNVTVYRNLGKVTKYGVDGLISYSPIREITISGYGSYLKSKIKDNVDAGATCSAANVAAGQLGCTAAGQVAFFQTKGKRESGAPTYTIGGRIDGQIGPVQLGIQAKRTGPRYLNDQNLPTIVGGAQVYAAKTPAYTTVDLDARLSLEWMGLNDKTYFQVNVINVFDKLYVGGFDGGATSNSSVPFAQIGAPRTVIGSVVFAL